MITNLYFKSKKSFVPFVPTDIAGCQLWLKADAGITKDGSNYVSQWADQSGNNNHAVQATGSAQPLWVDAQLNGLPVLRFDGSNDFMDFSEISNIRTIFIVAKNTTSIQNNAPILGHPSLYNFHSGSGFLFINRLTSANILNGNTYINGIKTQPLRMLQSPIPVLYSIETTGGVTAQYITNDRNIAGRVWNGDYVEIIIYSSVLSESERLNVQSYIQNKYNIDMYNYSYSTPNMTSDSAPSGVVTFKSRLNANFSGWRAFDNDKGFRYYSDGGVMPQWLQYQFPLAKTIRAYSVTPNEYGWDLNEALKSFKLQGSNDGINYNDLDSRTGQISWMAGEMRIYEILTPASYLYYRLYITETNGAAYVSISNIELYE